MEFAKTIDSVELNELPLKAFSGKIHLISNFDEYYKILPELTRIREFGFDTETRPSFKKGVSNTVALLQLATQYDVYLFRINEIGLPSEIREIFSNPAILKVGAAIHDDIKSLKGVSDFNHAGFVDLQDEVRKLEFECFSLKKLTAIILGFRISKSQQLSNWESQTLSPQQEVYAATDAWVSLLIYLRLLRNQVN